MFSLCCVGSLVSMIDIIAIINTKYNMPNLGSVMVSYIHIEKHWGQLKCCPRLLLARHCVDTHNWINNLKPETESLVKKFRK